MRYLRYTFLLLLLGIGTYAHERDSVISTKEFTVVSAVKTATITLTDLNKYKQEQLGSVKIFNHRGQQKGILKNITGVLLKNIVDSSFMNVDKPKDYSEYYILLMASDGYKNVYSWNEIYNTDIGNHIYIITGKEGKPATEMEERILVMSLSDINTGRRHLKNLSRIEIKRAD
ncbi:MAG: molybdopterin-binding protein [Bacteroidetes bacterium]|nr:molybdopterin-binding protein [Bacteroidota bacterium]